MDCSNRIDNHPVVEIPERQLFQQLPEEAVLEIFSYLNRAELAKCCLVSRAWRQLAKDDQLWLDLKIKDSIFGAQDCKKYFGEITKPVPPLPDNYKRILFSPDPDFPEQRTMENWMFLLMPEEIDGKPLNLETMEQLIVSKKIHKVVYRFISGETLKRDKKIPVEKSYWILKRKNIVPNSKEKSFEAQEKLVQNYRANAKVPTAREEVFFNFAVYAKFGERPYGDNPWAYGRCVDIVEGGHVTVGGFSPSGLDVDCHCFGFERIGVGARRKF